MIWLRCWREKPAGSERRSKQKNVEKEIPCEIKAVSMNKPQKKKKNQACMRENPFQSALPNKVRCWIQHYWWCKCYIWLFWYHNTSIGQKSHYYTTINRYSTKSNNTPIADVLCNYNTWMKNLVSDWMLPIKEIFAK